MTLGAGLRSRYARIKANLVGFEEGDVCPTFLPSYKCSWDWSWCCVLGADN